MELTISKENYLKAIAEAEAEGEKVVPGTLVRWLGVTPAAVTMATKRLQRDGHVQATPDGHIELTPAGRQIADRIRNRHHLIERMLTEMFGMEWYKVHDEAERLEHAVSEDFERKLIEKLGTKDTCPHGNQVTGDAPADRRERGWRTLDEVSPGEGGVIRSVYERDRRLLEHFDRLGLQPGASVRVLDRNSDETLTLEMKGRQISLGLSGATRVWVEPTDPA